jgi:hypothetical protein
MWVVFGDQDSRVRSRPCNGTGEGTDGQAGSRAAVARVAAHPICTELSRPPRVRIVLCHARCEGPTARLRRFGLRG